MDAPVASPAQTVDTIVHLPISQLETMPAPYNPRDIDKDELARLRESIVYFGSVVPMLVNSRTSHIVDGHQRLKAAIAEGFQSFPVTYIDVDETTEMELNAALNRIRGRWVDADLQAMLQTIEEQGGDPKRTGFTDDELARLLQKVTEGETDPDAVPSDVEQRCGAGDLWQLGDHRLLCGDSTKADDVGRLLAGQKPALTVTDPPYGVEYDPKWREGAASLGEVVNDDRSDWSEAWELVPGSVVYCWQSDRFAAPTALQLLASGFEARCLIIWSKPHFPISRGHYHSRHEPCWYAVRKGSKAHWIGDRTQSTVWEVSLDKNVAGGHSTQKPVELMRRAIANHKGDVYEPFTGSGTTLIACEQLGRSCFAMEIHPPYCDVTLQRWEQFTGEKAQRVEQAGSRQDAHASPA